MLHLVDLEAVETRYTCEWKTHLPYLFKEANIPTNVIEGSENIPIATTPGAFLNFGGTNIYKASQVEAFSQMFCLGHIKPGDQFLFTDAWHPGIINLKYMSELLQIPVGIHALWHAGSYDPADFLGRLIGDKPWVRHFEKSLFYAIDVNYFATNFHIDMFCKNLFNKSSLEINGQFPGRFPKILRSGWPFEYLENKIQPVQQAQKRDLILFPHRLAPEKQVNIFLDLKKALPEYEFVVCQDQSLSKAEYHNLLRQAKIVFSANLQETLGIGCYEGVLANAIPLVPSRLSYEEMYVKKYFVYDSEWTSSFESYTENKDKLVTKIKKLMTEHNSLITQTNLNLTKEHLDKFYFSATTLTDVIKYHVNSFH